MKTINYLGMSGTGANVREAKADASRKIEAYITGHSTPIVITHRGEIALIWRTPHGIMSSYIHPGAKGMGGTCQYSSDDSLKEVCLSVRLNLAQICADVTLNEIPEVIAGLPDLIRQYASWLGFQRAYRDCVKHTRATPEHAVHQWACENAAAFAPNLTALL